VIKPLGNGLPVVEMLTTLNYSEIMRAYFMSKPEVLEAHGAPSVHSALLSLGSRNQDSWELPVREKIALFAILVDIALETEFVADALNDINTEFTEARRDHYAEIREEKEARLKKARAAIRGKKRKLVVNRAVMNHVTRKSLVRIPLQMMNQTTRTCSSQPPLQ